MNIQVYKIKWHLTYILFSIGLLLVFGELYSGYKLSVNHNVNSFVVVDNYLQTINLSQDFEQKICHSKVVGLDFLIHNYVGEDEVLSTCQLRNTRVIVAYNEKLKIGTLINENPKSPEILSAYLGQYLTNLFWLLILVQLLLILVAIIRIIYSIYKGYKAKYIRIEGMGEDSTSKYLLFLDKSSFLVSFSIGFIFIYLFLFYLVYGMGFVESDNPIVNGFFLVLFLWLLTFGPGYIINAILYLKENKRAVIRITKKTLSLLFTMKAIYTIVWIISRSSLSIGQIENPTKLVELFVKQLIKL